MITEPLVLLGEWHDCGDSMLAPADPDPLRSWRTARYIVERCEGPKWLARKLTKPLPLGWASELATLAVQPAVEVPQPQPYATGRAELAARQMGRSLVLIADRYCGPGEAKRALDKLPAAFVQSMREELREEEAAAREKRRREANAGRYDHLPDDAFGPTGRQKEPDQPGVTVLVRELKATGRCICKRDADGLHVSIDSQCPAGCESWQAQAHQERYPRGWHPDEEERS